jgi:hypothetical protein
MIDFFVIACLGLSLYTLMQIYNWIRVSLEESEEDYKL